MPAVSEAQRRAMFAAAAGHSTLGIPQSVGKEYSEADKGGKLPAKAKDMSTTDWRGLLRGLFKFLSEEAAEPEHQGEDEQPHTRAAGVAFVTPTGDCLFLKRAVRGHAGDHATEWCFPGGEMEDGETAEDCARREALEEVGQDCVVGDAWDLRAAHQHTHDGVDFTTFYQPVAGQFNPKLNDEHTAFKWAPADAPPEPLHPGVRKTLDEIVAGLGEDAAMATAPNPGIPAATKTEDDTIDTATVDIPLLIRLMEYAREDAPDDEALHSATERLVALAQAENRPLRMEDYEKIVADAAADPSGKLSETTREDVDSQKHREDMPEDDIEMNNLLRRILTNPIVSDIEKLASWGNNRMEW